jgi:hypothetical protein
MLLNGYRLEDELSRTKAQDIPDRSARRRVLRLQKTIIDQLLKNALHITMPPAKSSPGKGRKLHVRR